MASSYNSSTTDELIENALAESRPSSTGWRRANCPLCLARGEPTPDTKASWGININNGKWHCFRCHAKGMLSRLSDGDAEVEYVQRAVLTEENTPLHPPTYIEPPDSWEPLDSEDGRTALVYAPAREYLAARGVSWNTIRDARIGVCDAGYYSQRIVTPVLARHSDDWLGFIARTYLTGAELARATRRAEQEGKTFLRYAYPKWPTRGLCLLNERALDVVTDEPLIAVEGKFSAFPYWPDVCAFLGKPTSAQIALLGAVRKRPIAVVLDGDAWEEGFATAMQIRLLGAHAGYVRLPPKTDPAEGVDPTWLREEARRCIM